MDITINATAKAIVTGNIRTIRSRTTRDDSEVLEISVPVDAREENEPATWYRVAFFGDRVPGAKKRFSEGDLVQITGDIEVDPYVGQAGPSAAVNIRFASVEKLRNSQRDDEASDTEDYGDVDF